MYEEYFQVESEMVQPESRSLMGFVGGCCSFDMICEFFEHDCFHSTSRIPFLHPLSLCCGGKSGFSPREAVLFTLGAGGCTGYPGELIL